MPESFAHISDLHLSELSEARVTQMLNKRFLGYLSWRRKRRFEHRLEVLQALRQDLRSRMGQQVVITGDLTHIGLPTEFRQARDWLSETGSARDIALVPGNHDACVRSDWDQTFALWQDYLAGDNGEAEYPSLRQRSGIAFIGLNSGCPKPPLMASGTVAPEQLEKLPDLLRQCAQQGLFRVVYLHHCPIPGLEKWRKRLTNASEVQSIVASEGAELVLHGHGHRAHIHSIEGPRGEIPVVAVPSASALGLHGADRAAYNHYELRSSQTNWQLDIQARRYCDDSEKFQAAERRQFQLRRP